MSAFWLAQRALALMLSSWFVLAPGRVSADEEVVEQPGPRAAASDEAGSDQPVFEVLYDVGLVPSEKSAHVSIRLGDGSEPVEWIRFRIDPLRYRAFQAEGELRDIEGGLEWRPPKGGGAFRYVFSIDHLRNDRAYDARCAKSWAIFRGEDLVPRMRIRTSPIARSESRLRLRLPANWGAAVPYDRQRNGDYDVDEPRTRFDRPSGWFAFGKIGVIRETIEGMRVAIAGPAGQGIRRMDMLALLSWTLPDLRKIFGRLPPRMQIVSAGDPMWRGGLSGPRSIYLHVDRPLIGEDGTSPLLHELMHSFMRARSGEDGDWIVEGLAELYSMEILRRSETLPVSRVEEVFDEMEVRARKGGSLRVPSVEGDARAKAVMAMRDVDAAIREATGRTRSLDQVVRILARRREPVTTALFRNVVEEVAGRNLDDVIDRWLEEEEG